MRKFSPHLVAGLGLATLFATSASAHIEMIDPPARYQLQDGSDNGIKSCPCGLGGSNRICNVAQDGSDPDRSERVSRFEAGSTVTLRFEEFVNHSGRFRVAFDPEGADMADFNANILTDIPDPVNASGQIWEIEVTLPNMTCSNCTLQLVQAMEVDQNTPIADPAPISSYYSCVDVELVPPGTLGQEPGTPDEPGAEDPGAEQPGAEQPDTQPPGAEQPGTAPAGAEPPAAAGDAPSGANTAGEMMGTPLIPVGNAAPADDATGSDEVPAGAVAMNGVGNTPTGSATGATQMLPPLPAVTGSNDSASGGCSLGLGEQRSGALGTAALGLLALFGLRQRRARR